MMKQQDTGRRFFLQAIAVCLASAGTSAMATDFSPASLDNFLAAASRLCDLKLDNRELAKTYLEALKAGFSPQEFDALVAAAKLDSAAFLKASMTAPLKDISQQAMLLWLTGMTADPVTGTRSVVSYTEAAAWQALPFTKPAAQCGGAFGYWADLPAAP